MKTHRLTRWLAWGLVGITLLGFVGMVGLQLAGCRNLFDPTHPSPGQAYGWLLVPVMSGSFAVLGSLITTYRPENRIGWLALGFGLFTMYYFFSVQYGGCALTFGINLPGAVTVLWLSNMLEWLFVLWLGLFVWLFPDGQFLSPRWKWLCLLLVGFLCLFSIISVFWPGPLLLRTTPNPFPELLNPYSLSLALSPAWETVVFQGRSWVSNLFMITGFVALFWRWHRAQGDVRQQIKWLAVFVFIFGTLFLVVEIVGTAVYPAIFDGWFYFLDVAVFFLGFPIAFGLSIFKYRLYDIDIIIRRTLVYGVVTVSLVVVYFGSVIILQWLFTAVTNQESPLAIVLSTLLIAALFNPLRQRVQTTIDRRFFRQKYDAQQVLTQFAQSARDETDIDLLTNELFRTIQETMQPQNLTIWIPTEER